MVELIVGAFVATAWLAGYCMGHRDGFAACEIVARRVMEKPTGWERL